jgi:hypothetical protein
MSTRAHWVPDRRDMIWIGFNPQLVGEMRFSPRLRFFPNRA